jgi:hypothetical protein
MIRVIGVGMDDDTTTWMGITLTHEYIYWLISEGLNPWLTTIYGHPVPLAKDDPRRELFEHD